MSVNISVSNTKAEGCVNIVNALFKAGIDCRTIPTLSIVNNLVETGCLITVDPEYSNKTKLDYLWNIIRKDYNCSHLKIDGIYDGCIYNYLLPDFCPKNKN